MSKITFKIKMNFCLLLLLFSVIVPIQFSIRKEVLLRRLVTYVSRKLYQKSLINIGLCSRVLPRCNPETSVPRRDHMRNFDRLGLATLPGQKRYYYFRLVLTEYEWYNLSLLY